MYSKQPNTHTYTTADTLPVISTFLHPGRECRHYHRRVDSNKNCRVRSRCVTLAEQHHTSRVNCHLVMTFTKAGTAEHGARRQQTLSSLHGGYRMTIIPLLCYFGSPPFGKGCCDGVYNLLFSVSSYLPSPHPLPPPPARLAKETTTEEEEKVSTIRSTIPSYIIQPST